MLERISGVRYTRASYVPAPLWHMLTGDSVTNVIADLLILALPVRFVLALHLDNTRKYQILGIFALGGM